MERTLGDLPVSKTGIRLLFVVLLLVLSAPVVSSYQSFQQRGSTEGESVTGPGVPLGADDVLVVTTQDGPTRGAALTAFGSDGTVLFKSSRLSQYYDVDPVAGTQSSVIVVGRAEIPLDECPVDTRRLDASSCAETVVQRVNLTTWEHEEILSYEAGDWHDVDKIGPDRYLVAHIGQDRVLVYNATSETVDWGWNAKTAYNVSSGGTYPGDWTHLNDVEHLHDGRVMVSLRNHDQVVFVNKTTGIDKSWTLGADGAHSTLFEQHNPDYINESNGGPAVLVADSENDRVVEYQRVSGEWRQTWTWGVDLQWPRDADRLPNGNTLVVDSHGDRVIVVDHRGEIVREVTVNTPYDAELLGSGDESTGGESARSLGIASRGTVTLGEGSQGSIYTGDGGVASQIKSAVPSIVLNSVKFVLPIWIHTKQLLFIGLMLLSVVTWGVLELRWSNLRISWER